MLPGPYLNKKSSTALMQVRFDSHILCFDIKRAFLLAKNRLVNKQLLTKSIPSLEFQAVTLVAAVLIDSFNKLSGPSCGQPINEIGLKLYTDSLVCLNWLNSCIDKLD